MPAGRITLSATLAGLLFLIGCRRASSEVVRQDSVPLSETVAQECSQPAYRQFDFWVGVWEVHYPDGRPAGINTITSILRGCALHEQWVSANPPYRGESFNTFRSDTETWHQTWIDNSGGMLLLEGRYANDQMVLEGVTTDSAGAKILNRITWSRPDSSANRIRQHWETSRDGRSWQTDFDGLYTRKP